MADLPVVSSEHDDGRSRGNWSIFDALGFAGVVVAGVLVLVPALAHGTFLGPYDILQNTGLNKSPERQGPQLNALRPDQPLHPVDESGVDPGPSGPPSPVEPLSARGDAPLAFNWESAPLSLRPDRIPVPRPARLHHAVSRHRRDRGHGVYVLGRVLRLGTLGCMTAAIVFE